MNYGTLLVAGLFRRRGRTLLTLASIMAAFALFGLLDAVRIVFNAGADNAGLNRLIVTSRLSLIQPLPFSQMARIQALEGVDAVAHANWFGGVYQDRKNFFPNIAVSPSEWLNVHPEIKLTPEARERFLNTRTAALAGSELTSRFNWQIDQKIPLEGTIFPNKSGSNTWTFDLVGVMRGDADTHQPFEGEMIFRYDYFDEGRLRDHGTVGWYVVRVRDPARSNAIAQQIDALFKNSDAETKTQSEKEFNLSFVKQFGDVGMIVSAIMAAVFFTVLLLTANTLSQAMRERIPELGILKTLGFGNGTVCALVLGESILLLLLGGLAGLAAAAALLPQLNGKLGAQLPPLVVSASSWISGLGIMLIIGLVVGLPPAIRAMRVRIVDALAAG
jgi:putative ABC transport system permease protein